jgi:transaldolase
VARTVDQGLPEARATVEALRSEGIDLEQVGEQLQREGIAAFSSAFAKMLEELGAKASALTAD